MKALRRVTKRDLEQSNLLVRLAIQVRCAGDAGRIDGDLVRPLIQILGNAHTDLLIKSGTIDRQRQKRYERRNKMLPFSLLIQIAVLAGFAIPALLVWVVV